ncbi:ComF family protein [Dietzia sp. ANT_WB102]|nr:ComF family protein [Dietzia sp. ANT_WB102]
MRVRTRADLGVPVWALSRHAGPAARAVSAYKDRGRTDLARPLGGALAAAVDVLRASGEIAEAAERPTVLVPAPASARARRRRGFDHVRQVVDVLAAELAGSLPGGPVGVAPVLEVRGRVKDASGLGARAREDNLSGRIGRRPLGTPLTASPGAPSTVPALLKTPSTVLLVDDVVTTGATAAHCVAVLESGGLRVTGVLTVTAA